jgi:predicted nucleotidyltransferase
MNVIFETLFGSHLYGLDTPSSDTDIKGIILPSRNEILLGNSKYHRTSTTGSFTAKNTESDVDKSFYTLSFFIDLAIKGDSTAMDMLHAPYDKMIVVTDPWRFIQANRSDFYTKSMKAYVGYARKQAAKYGIKGSRLGELERCIAKIQEYSDTDVIGNVLIDESDVVKWIDYKGNKYLEICGSKFQDNLKIKFARETLEQIFSQYGERTRLAKINQAVDWKALSHAIRVGYQTYHILVDNGFEYPLPESDYIMKVKKGELHFLDVEEELTSLIVKIETASNNSLLPDTVNREKWDNFIITMHNNIVHNSL